MMASLCAWHGSIIVQARIQKTHLHTWYLSFFLHAHILSHENSTLGKCVNLQQNCPKQYFSGSSGIFLHSAKNFTRTAFTAFMTNIRYANNEVKYHITPCSFFFSFIKVCLIFPVSMSLSVHMASEKQSKQGSFLFRPTSGQPSDLHQEVGVSFISPSLIRLFRDFSKMARE